MPWWAASKNACMPLLGFYGIQLNKVLEKKMWKFNAHVQSIVTRAPPRINIHPTGTNWGQQKATILINYMSIIRSLFMYAVTIWFSNAKPSLIQKLQIIQISALRIATGCVMMTSINHLLEETKMLPFQDHFSLISSQYFARNL